MSYTTFWTEMLLLHPEHDPHIRIIEIRQRRLLNIGSPALNMPELNMPELNMVVQGSLLRQRARVKSCGAHPVLR
jgi:hypothetical protein